MMADRIEAALILLLAFGLGLVGFLAFIGIWFLCYPLRALESLLKMAVRHG